MGSLSESESSVKIYSIPLVTLITDISLLHGSQAKSISYQKFNWQTETPNSSCVDSIDSINFVSTPSLFNEQLAIIPSETSTRVVFLLYPLTQSCTDEEPTLFSACSTTYEILEAKYNAKTRSDWGWKFSPPASGTSQLGFDFGRDKAWRPRPRLRWTMNDCENCRTMVVSYRTWSGQSIDTVVQSLINNWDNFTDADIEFINSSPIECFLPLINGLEAYFLARLGKLKFKLQCWIGSELGDPLSSEDESEGFTLSYLTKAWIKSRAVIESFELITQKLEDYQEGTAGIRENNKIQDVINCHRKKLQRARELEQYVRETLQWNVGRLSLIESRKSIQQSDTLGKLSILAFIFLPISLVTSFFGMNINELIGSGASWKAFFIAAGALCGLGFLTFLWVFANRSGLSSAFRFAFSQLLLYFGALRRDCG
ncbi:uncharacterized protein EAE98_002532 [Botrytis deweyae]|uniref:Uncharacterized protein n=1 Tax=Botrytis deweyae TaxID=2478750 RepID=A0ABQ7IXM3_9HELO|nr:uncharacterized protein EAE98_002532 [Botrytis deweyae]KAF7936313.1 hypothetical protein EAE98_002532 [Botrytis deweyae]